MTRTKILASLLTLAALSAGCEMDAHSLAPVIGERNAALLGAGNQFLNAQALSDKDEDNIGQSVAAAITSNYPPVASTPLQEYVNLVGITVSAASPRGDLTWYFGIIESPDVNAFSGPNGYVLVTRGAVMRMQDEAELAGVLAHEVAHCCNHDGLEQIKLEESRGAMVSAMKAADSRLAQLSVFADSGVNVITRSGYTQKQELNADEQAVRIMSKAGYDPNSYLNFLRRLQNSGGLAGGGRLMSTHPGIGDRISRVTAAIQQLPRTGPTNGATNGPRFTQRTQVLASLTPNPGMPLAPLQPTYPPGTPQPVSPVQPVYPQPVQPIQPVYPQPQPIYPVQPINRP